MADILRTTFSNAFPSMKMFEFRLKFHRGLFQSVQLTVFQHWFRFWLGAGQATIHYLKQWWSMLVTYIYATRSQWALILIEYDGSVIKYRFIIHVYSHSHYTGSLYWNMQSPLHKMKITRPITCCFLYIWIHNLRHKYCVIGQTIFQLHGTSISHVYPLFIRLYHYVIDKL